jgi:hypothetical protein
MKIIKVSATHSETLYPSLPGLEIEVRYFFTSEIETDEEDFEHRQTISDLMVSINGGPLQEYQTPSVITSAQNRFLSPLREAARKEVYKQQLAADATIAAQERDEQPREYRHSLGQMFPKGRVITPDNDDEYYGF